MRQDARPGSRPRGPSRRTQNPCACPQSSHSLHRWGGSDHHPLRGGQPWTLLGVFSSPCSYRRRHRVKCKWVKRCIVEQGASPGVPGPPTPYVWNRPCQSTTSGVQYSPKCWLSPGVDSMSVDGTCPRGRHVMPIWGPWP